MIKTVKKDLKMIKNSQNRLKNNQNTLFTDFINCFKILLFRDNIYIKKSL